MKHTIKATNMKLTEAVTSYTDKIVAVIKKYVDRDDDSTIVDVEVGRTTNHHRQGPVYKAEATVHSPLGTVRSVAEADDLNAAIDEVKDELSETLRTKKKKHLYFVRKSGLALKNMLKGMYDRGTNWRGRGKAE